MPILDREPDRFPENVLESPSSDQWWVLYTASRREKELMRQLASKSLAYFGPTMANRTRSPNGRVRTSYIPVFSGYVFLNGEDESRQVALKTNCVSTTLAVIDTDQLVGELRTIDRVIQSGLDLTREDRLEDGERVQVISGPLQGTEGKLLHRMGRQRLCVEIQFLQQGVSVDLDRCDIRAIG